MCGGGDDNIDNTINKYAQMYDVPAGLIKSVIDAESGGNTYAVRYEKGYPYTVKPYSQFHWHTPTERISQQTSWGLMQIMGAVARERGFEGNYLAKLCKPEIGIKYGVKHLKYQYDRYSCWEDAVSAYNQGSNRKTNGRYNNQGYVDKVMKGWDNGRS